MNTTCKNNQQCQGKKTQNPQTIKNKNLELIEKLKSELEAEKNLKLRALADLENMRRRIDEQKISWETFAIGNFLKIFLPQLLELQIGSQHSQDNDLKKVIQNFFNNLDKLGLKKIEPKKGEIINPEIHEVLLSEEGPSGTIVRLLEPGWVFGEKILKTAKISGAK